MKKNDFDINKFIRRNVQQMSAYSSARDEFRKKAEVYLDANENPFNNGVNRYPDPYQISLKEKLSKIKNIPISNILLGNGSDEVLDLVFRAFCEPKQDNVIFTPPTYGMYRVLAELNDIKFQESLLTVDFALNVTDILGKIDTNTKIIFLCSPNNPTGNCIPKEQIELILKKSGCLVVIDEAYIDFSDKNSWIEKLDRYTNLIVCQTLSKAWGMAGIRLGFCYASKKIIEVLHKIKPPYNVNVLTQKRALESLNNMNEFQRNLENILSEKEILKGYLKRINFVKKIYPTDANFWLIQVDDANKRYDQLIELNIVVRNRTTQPLCQNCLRITIGTPAENKRLIEAFKQI